MFTNPRLFHEIKRFPSEGKGRHERMPKKTGPSSEHYPQSDDLRSQNHFEFC